MSKAFQETVKDFSRVCQGYFRGVSREFQNDLKQFQMGFKDVSRVINFFEAVSRFCFKEVPRCSKKRFFSVLKELFKEVPWPFKYI